MIDQLILHSSTKNVLESIILRQPHAILIVGEAGSGKGTVARKIAEKFVGTHANIHTFGNQSEGGMTGIDEVRMLTGKSKHKRSSDSQIAWVIENAERLGTEAQSALLKILEEPPAQTYFILTTAHTTQVLSTIRSRCVLLRILQPPASEVKNLASDLTIDRQTLDLLLLLSQSCAGRFQSYLDEIKANGTVCDLEMIQEIKRHLVSSNFELMAWFSSLPKASAPAAIEKLTLLCRLSLRSATHKQAAAEVQLWQRRLSEVIELSEAIRKNGHLRVHIAARLFGY